ncbi:hypothetical protein HPB52_019766 [Rhipicephalus sanguineus]|uniref:Uncharacterized protein n=1 Tax=Rhipicephalus sanguineus TaxID=34632 RepID=A0A9D4Q842_RHISA|nr:hypothetical protein HPB52_019766 [Rhipicephalus sanguineus]
MVKDRQVPPTHTGLALRHQLHHGSSIVGVILICVSQGLSRTSLALSVFAKQPGYLIISLVAGVILYWPSAFIAVVLDGLEGRCLRLAQRPAPSSSLDKFWVAFRMPLEWWLSFAAPSCVLLDSILVNNLLFAITENTGLFIATLQHLHPLFPGPTLIGLFFAVLEVSGIVLNDLLGNFRVF